ncbi:protein of unknown function (plasmid) [Caballeronia sp. S22]
MPFSMARTGGWTLQSLSIETLVRLY